MGRLVTLCNSFQTSSSSDNEYVARHQLTSDVRWLSAWFSYWRSPFQVEAGGGNLDGGTVQILVDGSPVFEARVHGQIAQTRELYCLVIPWGDGLVFNDGQTFGWFLEAWNMQGLVAGGFNGEKI